MLKKLMELGLTKNQATVYLALIKQQEQRAGTIARTVSMDRSFVYSILNILIHKGLVGYIIIENKRWFYACHRVNLMKIIEDI